MMIQQSFFLKLKEDMLKKKPTTTNKQTHTQNMKQIQTNKQEIKQYIYIYI